MRDGRPDRSISAASTMCACCGKRRRSTELTELDGEGKEQLKVSRLAEDAVGSGESFAFAPVFTQAKAHGIWFSPVYFRKESEPYMTVGMARAGKNAGVTVAEINLKLIWDVITGLKIGQGGYAYVVDGRGRLIAPPRYQPGIARHRVGDIAASGGGALGSAGGTRARNRQSASPRALVAAPY
jgi:hypothetical protein